jgi:hypothetical protein
LDICTSFKTGIDNLADFFHVKIKFYQGWGMTKKCKKSFSKIKTAQMNFLAAEDINQSNMLDAC